MIKKTLCILAGAAAGAVICSKAVKKREKRQEASPALPARVAAPEESPVLFTVPGTPGSPDGTYTCSGMKNNGQDINGTQNILLGKGAIPIGNNEFPNVLVFGGSGSGKSCNIIGPNLMQTDSSYVITDPGGGLFRRYGRYLANMGYRIKCLNLADATQSNHYNPFACIRSDEDIDKLAEACLCGVHPEERKKEPSEYEAQLLFLRALIGYMHYYEAPDAQNFANIEKLIRMGRADIQECPQSPEQRTPLDDLFEKAKQTDPNGYAPRLYRHLCNRCNSTLRQSLLRGLNIILMPLFQDTVKNLTATDDIGLDTVGDRKTALFVIIRTADKSINTLATMLYTRLFRCLEDFARNDAPKTVSVVDANNEVVRTFRQDAAESDTAVKKEAEAFLERAKKGRIRYDNDLGLWILKTDKGEPVLWRGCKEEAEKAHALLRAGSVIGNRERNGSGHRLPTRIRFFFDEPAEFGRIPDFPLTAATFGKYGISFFFFPHAVSQMRNIYPDEWDRIMDGCGITVCLGGGMDRAGAKYCSSLSERIILNAKETPLREGEKPLFCKRIRKPLSARDLQGLPDEKCVIFVKPHNSIYFCDKCRPGDHLLWKTICRPGSGTYMFTPSVGDIPVFQNGDTTALQSIIRCPDSGGSYNGDLQTPVSGKC